jgi:HAE1 family hydrophobic/amphiphilic exporter-1
MPTGFIPSQDSGFFFGFTLAGQDISFDSMVKHQRAVMSVLQHDPNGVQVGAFVQGGNSGVVFMTLKPRSERKLTVDQVLQEVRPKLFGIPGIMAFLQNPPPITVSGQFATSVYQMVLQSANLHEIYDWTPRVAAKMRALPGFLDVNPDLQIASPQVLVDIDRDRAQALGVSPQQIQDALYTAYGSRQVSTIYTPANEYAVITEVEPKYQRNPSALAKL